MARAMQHDARCRETDGHAWRVDIAVSHPSGRGVVIRIEAFSRLMTALAWPPCLTAIRFAGDGVPQHAGVLSTSECGASSVSQICAHEAFC